MTDTTKLTEAIKHVEEIDNAIRTGDVMDVYRMQIPPNEARDSDFMVKLVLDAARYSLTLATESEQLRKERDELAEFIRNALIDYPDNIFKICAKSKKVIENGNA